MTASDEDNDGLTLSYGLSRPPGSMVLLADAETRAPAFVPDLPGLYRLTVVADDGRGRTAQAEAVTLVSAPPPDAGADVPVAEPDAAVDTRMPDAAPPDLGPIVPQGNGASCGGRGGCQSGNCVDGICCDSPCLGVCSSCNRPGLVGTCGPILSGQDPRDDCPSSGTCNGAGSCQPLAVRPGTELLLSGATVELAGEPNSRGDADPDQEGRVATACDPVSGLLRLHEDDRRSDRTDRGRAVRGGRARTGALAAHAGVLRREPLLGRGRERPGRFRAGDAPLRHVERRSFGLAAGLERAPGPVSVPGHSLQRQLRGEPQRESRRLRRQSTAQRDRGRDLRPSARPPDRRRDVAADGQVLLPSVTPTDIRSRPPFRPTGSGWPRWAGPARPR